MMRNLSIFLFLIFYNTPNFAQFDKFDFEKDFNLLQNFNSQQTSYRATLRTPSLIDSVHFFQTNFSIEKLNSRRFYQYDDNGNSIESIHLGFNQLNSLWENDEKIDIIYDSLGNMIEEISSQFDSMTHEWIPQTHIFFSYDSNGNQIESIKKVWNDTLELFENHSRFLNDYENNLLSESNGYSWENNEWNSGSRKLYSYNTDGLLEEMLWDISISFSLLIKYSYDNEGKIITLLYNTFSPQTSTWKSTSKIEFSYENGVLSESISSSFDSTSEIWVPSSRTQYTHDNFGNRIQENQQVFDDINATWINQFRRVYFFSDSPTSTNMRENSSLNCFFQNPIHSGRSIECQDFDTNRQYQISLLDLSGRVLLENTFIGEMNFNIPKQLQSGIYFLNIRQDGQLIKNEKIVVSP